VEKGQIKSLFTEAFYARTIVGTMTFTESPFLFIPFSIRLPAPLFIY